MQTYILMGKTSQSFATAMLNQHDETMLEGFHVYQIVPKG